MTSISRELMLSDEVNLRLPCGKNSVFTREKCPRIIFFLSFSIIPLRLTASLVSNLFLRINNVDFGQRKAICGACAASHYRISRI